MKTDWFRGDSPEDRKETKELLRVAKPVLDKLNKVCYNRLDACVTSKRAKPDYQSSSWAYIQADQNGYERAMKEIIELIESIEE